MKAVEGLSTGEARAAAVFRALGNPARLRIVRELAAHPGCMTGDLVGLLPLAQSTVSEHLRVLKEAGIVRGVIEGDRCYCLDPEVLGLIAAFCRDLEAAAACCDTSPAGRC